MTMIKKLKKWGDGMGIYFEKGEIERYGMVLGDEIDFSDMFLMQVNKKAKPKKVKNERKDI